MRGMDQTLSAALAENSTLRAELEAMRAERDEAKRVGPSETFMA